MLHHGLDWHDPATSSGRAFSPVLVDSSPPAARYADAIAHLKTSYLAFNTNQFAEATVYRAAGYSPGVSKHEVELLLRFSITAHDAHGYEVLWGHDGYLDIVRWNGALGSYTQLNPVEPNIGAPADGDVFRAEIFGSMITVRKNGTTVLVQDVSASGTLWSTGQPGVGFWPVDSSSPDKLGWKSFQAGNL